MHALPSVRLTAHLNALVTSSPATSIDLDEVIDGDVAHHVVDPEDLLDLDPLRANPLDAAVQRLAVLERERWVLTLPKPGALGSLRGPSPLNQAALEAGEAVLACSAGLGLVPFRVGQAVQWRVFGARRPLLPASPYDAERVLSETVLRAASTLRRLDVAAGARPPTASVRLPSGYSSRQLASADRAARLLAACDEALNSDGASISSYEVAVRATELRAVRDAAGAALCAAVTWLGVPPGERASV
jgi:hypothetical protein